MEFNDSLTLPRSLPRRSPYERLKPLLGPFWGSLRGPFIEFYFGEGVGGSMQHVLRREVEIAI